MAIVAPSSACLGSEPKNAIDGATVVAGIRFRQNGRANYKYLDLKRRGEELRLFSQSPKANFSTVALLPCDYLLVNLLDIVTILPWSRGSHNIRYLLY